MRVGAEQTNEQEPNEDEQADEAKDPGSQLLRLYMLAMRHRGTRAMRFAGLSHAEME